MKKPAKKLMVENLEFNIDRAKKAQVEIREYHETLTVRAQTVVQIALRMAIEDWQNQLDDLIDPMKPDFDPIAPT